MKRLPAIGELMAKNKNRAWGKDRYPRRMLPWMSDKSSIEDPPQVGVRILSVAGGKFLKKYPLQLGGRFVRWMITDKVKKPSLQIQRLQDFRHPCVRLICKE